MEGADEDPGGKQRPARVPPQHQADGGGSGRQKQKAGQHLVTADEEQGKLPLVVGVLDGRAAADAAPVRVEVDEVGRAIRQVEKHHHAEGDAEDGERPHIEADPAAEQAPHAAKHGSGRAPDVSLPTGEASTRLSGPSHFS